VTATVVISLDFELRWGMADLLGADVAAYRDNLLGVREVVPRLLECFARRQVRATWATVAAVALESWEEYRALAPPVPLYLDRNHAPPDGLEQLDPRGELHFAPELVKLVAQAPGQELASHSFSHFFFGEAGFVRRDAEADAAAVAALFSRKFGRRPRSFVFPRNQVAFIDVLLAHGIEKVRTNPPGAVWNAPVGWREWAPLRALRFAQSFSAVEPARCEGAAVPASAFVRLNLPEPLFRAHLAALANATRRLAERNVLHLWLHPHNLGDAPAERVRRLEHVLEAVAHAAKGEVRFVPMAEA
jgi:hypothetical protein